MSTSLLFRHLSHDRFKSFGAKSTDKLLFSREGMVELLSGEIICMIDSFLQLGQVVSILNVGRIELSKPVDCSCLLSKKFFSSWEISCVILVMSFSM